MILNATGNYFAILFLNEVITFIRSRLFLLIWPKSWLGLATLTIKFKLIVLFRLFYIIFPAPSLIVAFRRQNEIISL
jgi:hypothetical protein